MENPNFNDGEKFDSYPIKAKIDNPVPKELKEKIDREAKGRRHSSQSMFSRYESLPKRNGFVNARQFLI